MWQPNLDIGTSATVGATDTKYQINGLKQYELQNHLGNVMATISDRRVQVPDGSNNLDHLEADVINAQDYYAFGMQQPGRTFAATSASYRYGFNGKENDQDVGHSQNYGEREYDYDAGRFWSLDPLTRKYPELTPYQFASNSPIASIDQDGLESVIYSITRTGEGASQIRKVDVKHLDQPGPLGSGAAVILNKDGVTSYLYGETSKDMMSFVVHYEGKKDKVYSSLEGGNPTGGIGHKLTNAETKVMPVGTKLSEETIANWFKGDWKKNADIVEKNKSTNDLTGSKKDALTDAVFNNISASKFTKGDDETFFLRFLKGQMGTVKLRIGQLILFKDGKGYNLDVVKEKKNQETLDKLVAPPPATQPTQSTQPTQQQKQ